VGGKGFIYFEVVTTLALIFGLVVANVCKPGAVIATNHLPKKNLEKYTSAANEMNWGEFFSHIVPHNIIHSFAKGDLLQILFFGVLFSIAITKWEGAAGVTSSGFIVLTSTLTILNVITLEGLTLLIGWVVI